MVTGEAQGTAKINFLGLNALITFAAALAVWPVAKPSSTTITFLFLYLLNSAL